MAQAPFSFNTPVRVNPWILFFVFLTANSLLSYFTLSIQGTLWVAGLGLILPLILGISAARPASPAETPLTEQDFFKKIPFWIWLGVGLLALFLRFDQLTTLSAWPTHDEGMFGFSVMHMMRCGADRFFPLYGAIPPAYPWLISWAFKLAGPSLFNLWFWPAFFSALWVPLAYWAARQYFSKSFSFFCVLLAALTFWPCYAGRFSANAVLVLPLEALAFLLLGKCLRASSAKDEAGFAAALGFSVGLSFYAVYLHWISVAAVMALTMGFVFMKRRPRTLAWFGLGLALPLVPFMILCFQSGGGFYLQNQSILSASAPWLQKIQWVWNTPQNIFWGASTDKFGYKSVWGGLVNPVLGALCGVGLIEMIRSAARPLYRWLFIALFFFLAPGMLGSGFEFYRVIPVPAVLIPIMGLGWARLTQAFPSRGAAAILLFLLIPSLALDGYQLLDIYPHLWDSPAYWMKEAKSLNHYRAFQILQSKSVTDGPGLIFSDFVPGYDDQAIQLADYSFNGVNNDKLDWQKAKWAALIVNVNYQPFLAKRLGAGQTYWLSKDLNSADGGWMLWLVEITGANRPVFNQWREASQSLNQYIYQNFQNPNMAENAAYDQAEKELTQTRPLFQGDPFLEACYEEKQADLFYKAGHLPEALSSLNEAVEKGYPAAHLFYQLGALQMMGHHEAEARKNFQKALHASVNLTQSALFLNLLRGKTNAQF